MCYSDAVFGAKGVAVAIGVELTILEPGLSGI